MTSKTFEVPVPIPFHQDWVCCGIQDAIGEGFKVLAHNYEGLRKSDNTLRALLSISRRVTDGGPLKIDESGIDEKYLPIVDAIFYAEKIRREEDAAERNKAASSSVKNVTEDMSVTAAFSHLFDKFGKTNPIGGAPPLTLEVYECPRDSSGKRRFFIKGPR